MSSIPKMRKREAVSVSDFYQLLDRWQKSTSESTVGDVASGAGIAAWVWVSAAGQACRLHADATREGVGELLRLHRSCPNGLEWHVVANNRGNFNKIAFGPDKVVVPGLFLYLGAKADRGFRLG